MASSGSGDPENQRPRQGTGSVHPEEEAATELIRRGWSLAVAESCTGGLVMKRLTDQPGSSRFLTGGVVAYDNRVKLEVLGVGREVLDTFGAVSREVVVQMARGVASALGTQVGLAVTGIAGPDGGTPDKPVGTVWLGVALPSEALSEKVHCPGDRSAVREAAARCAVELLVRTLTDRSGDVHLDHSRTSSHATDSKNPADGGG